MRDRSLIGASIAIVLVIVFLIGRIHALEAENINLALDNNLLQYEVSDAQTKLTTEECENRIREELLEQKIRRLNPVLADIKVNQMAEAFRIYSMQYDLDVNLMLAIAREESRLNQHAVSPVGALGIMQVMPLWIEELPFIESRSDLLEIDKNIHAGAFILRQYLDMFDGNRKMALLAYNRGPATVNNHLRVGTDPDNGYPGMVLASYNVIRR